MELFLNDERPMILMDAIDAIGSYSASIDPGRVIQHLHHDSPYVRGAVHRFLARTSGEAAIPLLIDALRDPHPVVRSNAVAELEDLCAVEAVAAVADLLTDPDKLVREAASAAIQHFGECRTVNSEGS